MLYYTSTEYNGDIFGQVIDSNIQVSCDELITTKYGTRETITRQVSRGHFGMVVYISCNFHTSVTLVQLTVRWGLGLQTTRYAIQSMTQVGSRSYMKLLYCLYWI